MKKELVKIMTIIAMLCALLSSSAYAETGIDHEFELSLLSALNIVPEYPSTSYNASGTVTQEKFIDYAYRLNDMYVSDVSSYASYYGMAGGSETVTGSQAVKIVLTVVGYDKIVNNYNNSFDTMASNTGLLSGTGISLISDTPITYDNMVMLFYNAINMRAVVTNDFKSYTISSENVMEHCLKTYEKRGIVNSTNVTSLTGYDTAALNEVRIGDRLYDTGRTTADKFLGYYVRYFYTETNDGDVIKWIEAENNKSNVIVYGCDVISVDDSGIRYYTSTSEKTARADNAVEVIYNGKRGDELIGKVMSLTACTQLLDNNNNGRYDVVIISDYQYFYVDGFSTSNYIVSDFKSNTSVVLNPDRTISLDVYKDNIKTDVSAISTGQMLAVAQSIDEDVKRVYILTSYVSGEITAFDSSTVTILGTQYDISPAYEGDRLKLGSNGTFYLDMLGKIVRCGPLKTAASKYGYMINYVSEMTVESGYVVNILTANGTSEYYNVKSNISFNGKRKSAGQVYTELTKGKGTSQLVTYNLNSDGDVSSLNTADYNYMGIDESTTDFSIHFVGAAKYRKSNMRFNTKYLIDASTTVFVLPYDGKRENYTVKGADYFVNNTAYDISVYDIDNYMYASCIVVKENVIEPENLRSKRSIVITNVSQALTSDDEIRTQIEGYQQGAKVSYFINNENMYDNRNQCLVRELGAGDVIQVGINVNGYINAVQLLYKSDINKMIIASGTATPNKYWDGGSALFPDLYISCGKIVDRSTDVILVDDDNNDSAVTKDPHKIGNSTYVYLYENGKLSVSNKNEIQLGSTVYVHEYQGNVQEIVIVR